MTRRDFALSLAAPALTPRQRVCLFTDHLSGFAFAEVARMLAELGVTGPDLTLRRGGLVLPERVEEDLPMAAAAFRDKGLAIPMVTTTVTSAADEMSRRVLRAIARQGIGYYKLGYFYYKDLAAWRQTIDQTRTELQALAKVNQTLSLKAGLHNHAGDSVGCAIWDAWEALEGVDPLRAGFYFDPAQATIEGGKTGWNLNFRRIQPRLLMVAIKDFVWEKTDKGWRTRWVPLGQGVVNWDAVFPLLNAATFPGPVSLHIEYDPGGKSPTERYDRALEAAARDLQFLRARLT